MHMQSFYTAKSAYKVFCGGEKMEPLLFTIAVAAFFVVVLIKLTSQPPTTPREDPNEHIDYILERHLRVNDALHIFREKGKEGATTKEVAEKLKIEEKEARRIIKYLADNRFVVADYDADKHVAVHPTHPDWW